MFKRLIIVILILVFLCMFTMPVTATSYKNVLIVYSNKYHAIEALSQIHSKNQKEFKNFPVISAQIEENQIPVLLNKNGILSVEMDYQIKILDEIGDSWGVKRIGAIEVHQSGIMGDGVKLAVIDTGIDYRHPELASIYKGGYDFVNNDSDPMDDNSHGTHVAGILAAAFDGNGIVGVAPNIELYAIKVLNNNGYGILSDIIAGLDWCIKNDIFITNNSYGGTEYSKALDIAFQITYEKGILSIAGAGNNGGGINADRILYPARLETVMAVAATDNQDNRAFFSSTGPAVEVSAPGLNIYSTILSGEYSNKSGTSMSCPHVAGLAALVKSAHLDWGNTLVRGQIRATTDDLGIEGHNWEYGFGLINAVRACGELDANVPDMPELPPPIEMPEPITRNANVISGNIARLNGFLDDMGTYTEVEVYFYIGKYKMPSTPLYPTPRETLYSKGKFAYTIEGLEKSTIYLWCFAVKTPDSQIRLGEIKQFITKNK